MKRTISRSSVWSLLRGYRANIVVISFMMILYSLLQVSIALLMRFVIDAALENNGRLLFWGIVLVADLVVLIILYAFLSWFSGSVSDRFVAQVRKKMLTSAIHSCDIRLQAYHSGELMARGMEDVQTVCDGFMYTIPSLIGQLASLLAAFVSITLIYPPIAAVLFAAAIVIGLIASWLRPFLKKQQTQVRKTDERIMAEMQENLQQLELIQSLQVQQQTLARFGMSINQNLFARFKRRLWHVGSTSLFTAVFNLATGTLLLWGAVQISVEMLSYGSLMSLIQLLAQFKTPVLGISGLWSKIMALEVAAERLKELLAPAEQRMDEPLTGKVKAIVFDHVTFTYSGEEIPVLSNFSARLPLDSWTCLTGLSGKGKTTMFKLILGLYAPQEGSVCLETEQGMLPCSEATRYLFAYVPQDYALFSGTVLENLQLVAPDADEASLRAALKIADAEFIWDMASAEQTQVRENNTGLSKGQIQRLAIARAVLMQRPIFLLDECTSALDAQTEASVLRNLRAMGKQAILVTHRPEVLDGVDEISYIPMDQS